MDEKKVNFYTVNQVYDKVFQGTLSKTTIHHMIKQGKIPSVEFVRKKLIPAYWVEKCIAKAHGSEII
ncbi:hypothetical protein [Pectinatus frisingensis]|uniref:hypothetical protein n=1 Tax=Pectinatus frisingensis TaxID=865 RepID=UPI0018C806FF|nr:hypothetical protein [Pectinatus frisingensis]